MLLEYHAAGVCIMLLECVSCCWGEYHAAGVSCCWSVYHAAGLPESTSLSVTDDGAYGDPSDSSSLRSPVTLPACLRYGLTLDIPLIKLQAGPYRP
ncbi:hypothetical protein J6590_026481 [Homalodisca vitripennis]|nr:hypothetical protein J6590_026481 [Homalodisca vitripennis]